MKLIACVSFFVLCVVSSNAQKIILYKMPKGRLFTAAQIDSTKAAMRNFLVSRNMTNLTPYIDVKKEYISGDTLFREVSIGARDLSIGEKQSGYIGKELTVFSFRDIQGKLISTATLRGKPFVVNLWFTSCAPCIAEIPGLNKMKKAFPHIIFLAITYESAKEVRSFLATRAFNFIQIADQRAFAEKWQMGYPTTLFIDKGGIVRDVMVGSSVDGLEPERFKAGLKKIL